ncbi:recombinase family protein [Pontibacter sp. 172403-2]|uniref:recombinase family protein n=1 Tax=Pontibacter rufus TaxID=2791028 RepID=UPI0018AFDE8B|nr:recombinase family protein [Pontibacter sp. 172403-2]MBF9255648.1 recombinase family protein [Pontibacter sp. 172403-2]
MEESKPIVVYYRVSTKKQGESGLGLEAQRIYVQHFYSDSNIIAEFTEKVSGKVVAKIDRLSLNTEQALAIYAQLESCDIPNLDKFTLTLFMAIADRERELISVRTKAALDEKRKRVGEWRLPSEAFVRGTASPAGVAAIREKAQANENNRKAAALVRSLRVFQGLTWRQIAEELNRSGFKTSKGSKFQATQATRLCK